MSVAGIGNTIAINNLDLDLGSGTPATWYVALLTTMPTDGAATALVEAAWTGYARPAITNNGTNFPNATAVSNIATSVCQLLIAFGAVSGLGSPITVVGIALCSAASAAVSGSNMGRTAVFGTPTSPVSYVLNNGSSLSIAAGNLSFQEV
jgi:hypothetical protein